MKKGDIRISYIIGALISALVLVFVFYGIYNFYSGGSFSFFRFLGFNSTKERIEGVEIMRYSIPEDKVSYYDGTDWITLKEGEKIKLGKYNFDVSGVKTDFQKFFYEGKEMKIVSLGLHINTVLAFIRLGVDAERLFKDSPLSKGASEDGIVDASINDIYDSASLKDEIKRPFWKAQNGDVEIILLNKKGFSILGRFVLSLDDKFTFWYLIGEDKPKSKVLSFSEGGYLADIFNSAKKWRDSVFERPIPLSVAQGDLIGPLELLYVCVDFKDKKYLIVHLEKIVKSDEKCVVSGGSK